jgi:hypothetical protein
VVVEDDDDVGPSGEHVCVGHGLTAKFQSV